MREPPSVLEDPRPTMTTTPDPHTAVLDLRQNPTTTAPPEPVPPELCGWIGGTSAHMCPSGYTCKFNTDWFVVGCCSSDYCRWVTSCCGYNPEGGTASWSGTTSECGGPNTDWAGYCGITAPFCGTYRFEDGYTKYMCRTQTTSLSETILFTSAGETTARAGILKLTGSNGPALAVTTYDLSTNAITVTVTPSPSALPTGGGSSSSSTPSPGIIAGSVVGGAFFGAIITLLAVLVTWYFRKRSSEKPKILFPDQSGSTAMYQGYNGGGSIDPRYSAIPPSGSIVGGVSPPNAQNSAPNSNGLYSVPKLQYSSAPVSSVGSPPPPPMGFKDNVQYGMTSVVEAPGGDGNGQFCEMPGGR